MMRGLLEIDGLAASSVVVNGQDRPYLTLAFDDREKATAKQAGDLFMSDLRKKVEAEGGVIIWRKRPVVTHSNGRWIWRCRLVTEPDVINQGFAPHKEEGEPIRFGTQLSETWAPTNTLQLKKKLGGECNASMRTVLQQKWVSWDGREEFRDVPLVEED